MAACAGASETPGSARRALAADFERDVGAEADALVREKARGFRDGLVVDEGAVAAAEVFDQQVVVVDREPRVPAREQRRVRAEIDAGLAPDDVFAGRQRGPRQLGAGVAEDDLGQRDVHRGGSRALEKRIVLPFFAHGRHGAVAGAEDGLAGRG